MNQVITSITGILWSKPLIYLCIGVGIFFTLKSRVLQVRNIKEMVRLMFSGMRNNHDEDKDGVSTFQAFAMTVAGCVGTGNIAGVATAIALGGPGAIFWMWVVGLLGAATAFIECTLAQIYKVKIGNEFRGGPSYYIEKGLKWKWFASLFAIITAISYGISLLPVQANAIAVSLNGAFGFNRLYVGIVISILFSIVVFGGVKRIAGFAARVVPFMALGYLLVASIVLIVNIKALPATFALIIKSAFGGEQIFAGMVGSAISFGVRRGLYSNEAGEGTAPHAAAASYSSHPAVQGLMQSFAVYLDTIIICTATALVILVTGKYNVHGETGEIIVNNIGNVEMGPIYTQMAVETVFSSFGSIFVAIALLFFAFTSIVSGYYYGETSLVYLVGQKKGYIYALRFAVIAGVLYGTVKEASIIWKLADIGLGAMYWVNLTAIIFLFKPALIALKDYESQIKQGILEPKFDPSKIGIENATYWMEEFVPNQVKIKTPSE